ncbi:MAG: response regulator transcription factor [Ktedonobacteraceae bacterium]|nr:response regulator transcription factor [Ktedonobacteraceae bacterium]
MAAMKIMLADEHRLVMEGIRLALEKYAEFAVIGTAQDGITLLERFKKQIPDIVLMELHMPRLGGLETCRLIARKYPQVKVIILTACQSDMYVGEAFRAGARGYISKTVTAQELAAALRTVYEAGILVPPFAALHLLRTPTRRDTVESEPLQHLTAREREILSLVVEGRTTHDIAGFFFISPKTVRNHLSHIYEKLGTRDRLQTVLYMQQLFQCQRLQMESVKGNS